jgi:hypothetical protein
MPQRGAQIGAEIAQNAPAAQRGITAFHPAPRTRGRIGATVLATRFFAREPGKAQCQTSVGWAKVGSTVPTLRSTEALSAWVSLRSTHPTRKKEKEAERRQTHCRQSHTSGCGRATDRDRLAPTRPLSGALACRRSTTALAKGSISSPRRDPGQASWLRHHTGRTWPPAHRTHFQRCTPHAGRSAGRHDARTARERADEATPAGTALAPLRPASPGRRPFRTSFDSLVLYLKR